MFQLLITVNLKSSVGAGVAISTTIASFTSERLADIAYDRLIAQDEYFRRQGNRDSYTKRLVEKLYKPTQK